MLESVQSPCVDVCQLDPGKSYCIGCFRTLGEIGEWSKASSNRRQEIVMASDARKKQSETMG